MHEYRPILQKGDNFRVPGESAAKRYVAETFRAQNAAANPRVTWSANKSVIDRVSLPSCSCYNTPPWSSVTCHRLRFPSF